MRTVELNIDDSIFKKFMELIEILPKVKVCTLLAFCSLVFTF